MATYATNLTTFWLEGATTVTAIGTGGAGLGNPETDFFIQGTDCISKAAWTNATKGFIIDALATTFTVPTDGAVIFFAKYDAAGSLDTKTNGGLQCIIGSGSGDYNRYYIGGKDTLAFDSWLPYVIDPNTATADGSAAGTPSGAERWVGVVATLPSTQGPTKGNPIAMDAIRYGRCDLEYTSTACTFSGAEAFANDTSRRWGLIALRNGSYLIQGFHSFGTSGASVTFTDSNKVLFILPSGNNNLTNDAVSTAFNRIEILNASSTVTWDNISISALGTRARGVFVHTAGTIAFTNCQFTDMDTFTLLAGSVITTTTWRRCNAITAPGSTLNSSSVVASTVAADAAAMVWNVATDPDGKLDDLTFVMGAAAHHALELGASTPVSISLRGWTVTGFSAADGNNDSVIYNTSGKSITVNVFDATGTISFKNSGVGSATTVVSGAVSATVTVKDTASPPVAIENARVFLPAATGGPFPFNITVTIVNSTTTATVTHTAHGLATNDKVLIDGASHWQNNGVFSITNTGANTYTYTMPSDPGSSPTGTIKATFVVLSGLTDSGGQITMSRVFASAQPVSGWARKSSGSPYYQTGPITGSVSSSAGFDTTIQLIADE